MEASPVNMKAVEREPIRLQCRAPSYPHPQVTWKMNGAVLPHTEQSINKVAYKNDSGTYECMVSSVHGKDTYSFNLTVEGNHI